MILRLNISINFPSLSPDWSGVDAAEADIFRDRLLVATRSQLFSLEKIASSVRLDIALVRSRRFPHEVLQCLRVSDPDDLLACPENDGIIDHCVARDGRVHR